MQSFPLEYIILREEVARFVQYPNFNLFLSNRFIEQNFETKFYELYFKLD